MIGPSVGAELWWFRIRAVVQEALILGTVAVSYAVPESTQQLQRWQKTTSLTLAVLPVIKATVPYRLISVILGVSVGPSLVIRTTGIAVGVPVER